MSRVFAFLPQSRNLTWCEIKHCVGFDVRHVAVEKAYRRNVVQKHLEDHAEVARSKVFKCDRTL